jgi:hypothetical protein
MTKKIILFFICVGCFGVVYLLNLNLSTSSRQDLNEVNRRIDEHITSSGDNESRATISANLDQYVIRGNPDGLLIEANKWLLHDEQNIVGLLLKFEYDVLMFDLEDIGSTCNNIISSGNHVRSKMFSQIYPSLVLQMEMVKNQIPHFKLLNKEENKKKAYVPKPMLVMSKYFVALEEDGILMSK